jgi:dihydroneopterin aldolase
VNPAPVIVKLGGSFAGDSRLADWGAMLAAAPCPVLIVPGGGPFADAVREAQGPMGYSDRAAHRMAILAMAQYGEALADRFHLPVVATEPEINALRGAAVWSPLASALDDPHLPASWDLTSDSIAAWLAARLRASGLLLVKQALPPGICTDDDAATAGLTDPLFPGYAERLPCPVWIAGPDGAGAVASLVAKGEAKGPGFVRLAYAQAMRRAV